MEIAVCPPDGIPEGEMRQFELNDGVIVMVCRIEGQLYAVDGLCPHRGAQLASGTLEGNQVICPWHEWSFNCTDGCGITNPQSTLDRYAVSERDGSVYLELPD